MNVPLNKNENRGDDWVLNEIRNLNADYHDALEAKLNCYGFPSVSRYVDFLFFVSSCGEDRPVGGLLHIQKKYFDNCVLLAGRLGHTKKCDLGRLGYPFSQI